MQMLTLAAMLAVHGCIGPCSAGILANFEAEVGPALDPCTSSSSGMALPQWAGARKRRMLATLGAGWCNAERQIELVFTELREMRLLDLMLRQTDPGQAARMFMLEFERPRMRDPRHRMERARTIYRELGGR